MKSSMLNDGVCPHCGSSRVKVTSSQRPRRFFKCLICGRCWQCLEIIEAAGWVPVVIAELIREGRLCGYDSEMFNLLLKIASK